MLSYGVIYVVTNLINSMEYIGQTCASNPKDRFRGHLCSARKGRNNLLDRSIRKYGQDNFKFSVLFHCIDQSSLDMSEILFIKLFNTLAPNGYNIREGGNGGGKLSEKTKDKLRNIMTEDKIALFVERMNSPEIVKIRNKKLAELWADPVACAERAAKFLTEEYRIQLSIRSKELFKDENFKIFHSQRISESLNSPEINEKLREGCKIAFNKPEIKKARSDRFKDEEYQKRHSAAVKLAMNEPERKARLTACRQNRMWINDGNGNCRSISKFSEIPEGWKRGKGFWKRNK